MPFTASKSGLLFIISAPAGTGKTTLAQLIVANMENVVESISYTTRSPRNNEIEDVHYHFISKEAFEEKIASGDFLEHAEVYGNYYGTSRSFVEKELKNGKHVLLVIDTQGALELKQKSNGIFIFLSPPSLAILKQRLQNRSTESSEEVKKRLLWAEYELEQVKQYDYCIINEQLEETYEILRAIILAEEHRIRE